MNDQIDPANAQPDRSEIDALRSAYLDHVREAFAKALGVVQSFRELSAQNPEDTELRGLTEMLYAVTKQLLNTVTVKVAANGIAADWERLFGSESEHHDSG